MYLDRKVVQYVKLTGRKNIFVIVVKLSSRTWFLGLSQIPDLGIITSCSESVGYGVGCIWFSVKTNKKTFLDLKMGPYFQHTQSNSVQIQFTSIHFSFWADRESYSAIKVLPISWSFLHQGFANMSTLLLWFTQNNTTNHNIYSEVSY